MKVWSRVGARREANVWEKEMLSARSWHREVLDDDLGTLWMLLFRSGVTLDLFWHT